MSKLSKFQQFGSLSVDELFAIKGGCDPSKDMCQTLACASKSCESKACTSNLCYSGSCVSLACYSKSCSVNAETPKPPQP